ncbi:BadF/BadG/BcrA/BcrD ATPase family protein [Kineococcus sp. SYSU DK005]|uniref:BadF/BadG/BcrA/BcrD ATPase family protein n=1 Tax=Kineococcus sp. SYSU DK005 TaxID=3383126 RepID=UPI003D7EFB60
MREHPTATAAPAAPPTPASPAGGTPRWVGVDVGGTKTHVAALREGGERSDVVVASADWRRGELFGDPRGNLARLAALITRTAAPGPGTTTTVGAHGCDSPAQVEHAGRALAALLPGRVRVVNDAALLGPAAGVGECLQLVLGTGAVALGATADGRRVRVGGHGWLLDDHGSAPGLVREAFTAVLRRDDRGLPLDSFGRALAAEFRAPGVPELALAFAQEASESRWGSLAPLVFEHAAAGAPTARRAVSSAVAAVVEGLQALVRRGAAGRTVVAAGGVVVGQPVVQEALRAALAERLPGLALVVLERPPVDGALALSLSSSPPSPSRG